MKVHYNKFSNNKAHLWFNCRLYKPRKDGDGECKMCSVERKGVLYFAEWCCHKE